ncbi:MAG: class I SAM-dependent methyltransferase [Minicystis sp.]
MKLAFSPIVDRVRGALFAAHHDHVHVPRVERVARALATQIGAARSILDVGCGDGTVARRIAAAVGADRVAGVDIKVRPEVAIEVTAYDGTLLPFPDRSFEAVTISDVLHHCEDPRAVLREALRVADRVVAIKDHFRFGPVSEKILLWMDQVGNAAPGVHVRGTYWSPGEWVEMVNACGGRFGNLTWPLQIHDYPFRIVTRDELQFAARIEHARADGKGQA